MVQSKLFPTRNLTDPEPGTWFPGRAVMSICSLVSSKSMTAVLNASHLNLLSCFSPRVAELLATTAYDWKFNVSEIYLLCIYGLVYPQMSSQTNVFLLKIINHATLLFCFSYTWAHWCLRLLKASHWLRLIVIFWRFVSFIKHINHRNVIQGYTKWY